MVDVFAGADGQPAYFGNISDPIKTSRWSFRFIPDAQEEIIRSVFVTHGFEEYTALIRKLIRNYGLEPPLNYYEEDYFRLPQE